MKKTRFIALALVVAIALMGAGYAYWSDTLYVESTVNTGFLDVDFINVKMAKLFGKEIKDPDLVDVVWEITKDDDDPTYGDHKTFDVDNPMANRDKVLLTINNFYPGAKVSRVVTVQNTGTVPAKINPLNLLPRNYDAPKTSAMGLGEVEEDDIEITVELVDENEVNDVQLNGIFDVTLDVGETMDFRVNFEFKWNSGNNTEHKTYTYLMELPFEQGEGLIF